MVYGLGAVLILHFLAACGVMEIVWQIGKRVCKGEKSVKVLRFLYQSCILVFSKVFHTKKCGTVCICIKVC